MGSRKFLEGVVSIVTPVYNGEKHLFRYLDSVLRQTYNRLELILVDDGSEDGTIAIAESYRKRMEERGIRFRILSADHKNASAALQRGLFYVTGEYLIWPDSDDVLEQESIAVRVQFLKDHPEYQSVRSLSYYFDFETGERTAAEERRGNLKQEQLFWDVLESRTFVCCGCYMLRSKAFFEIYPDGKIPVYNVGQNFQMLLPILYRYPCPTIDTELYGVAVRKGSHSRRKLTYAETVEKYQEYENLIDDIVKICHGMCRNDRKRIQKWKLRRRLQLAFQYRQCWKAIKACGALCILGEGNLLSSVKRIVWMWIRNRKIVDWIHRKYLIKRLGTAQKEYGWLAEKLREMEWRIYKYRKRKKIKGMPTIIASNCAGTMIYYDMNLPWCSPTINLSMDMNDFVKFVENLSWYLNQEIVPEKKSLRSYPVGKLGDIRLEFVHYSDFNEAVEKWKIRKERIDWNHIFVIGSEKDGCTYETLKKFEQLPYKNKVIFTKKEYPEFPSAYYIKGFEECKELGVITFFKPQYLKRRYLDEFDYVSFLNGKVF
mgnify:CR=1 FL=1